MFRLILGPSGSGKTTAICKEIIDRSLREPETHFFILVPDQFTMQTQMDVVRMHPGKGILNIDVLSFSRLIHRVFDETGAPRERILDDLGKSLLLRRTAQNIIGELPVIGSGMSRAGYVDEVKSVISEFMQYNISPEGLNALIENAGNRKALQARLTDLQKLYQAFTEALSQKYLTSEETLTVCASRIPKSKLFQDAVIAVDGFTGFTPVQYLLLRALYAHAREMTFSFTLREDAQSEGKEGSSREQLEKMPAFGNELFSLTFKTIADLTRHMWEEESLMKPTETPPLNVWSDYRREHAGDLYMGRECGVFLYKSQALIHLEENLFARPVHAFHEGTNDLELVCCLNMQEEIRQTFRKIHERMRADAALMYRDFAIVCADLETYGDTLEHTAALFDIPIFRDQTRSVSRNPLFEYLRSILEIMRTSFDRDAVFQYLRSGLAPYSQEDVNLLDTYATARRVRGKKAWNNPFVRPFRDNVRRDDEQIASLTNHAEIIRSQISESLAEVRAAFEEKRGAGEVTKALFLLMEKDGVADKLLEYENTFLEADKEAEASEYRQIYAKVVSLLEAMYELLGDEKLTPREYAEVLEAGFAELKVGTIPQNVDRVQIGDLERTRLREVKYLYFLGVHDGVIPGRASGGGILSEIDREYLRINCPEVELAPTPQELMSRQLLYLYMTMTKPISKLTVSYPKQDGEAKSLRPAYIIARLQKMFPTLSVSYPERDAISKQTETKRDLYARLSPLYASYAAGLLKTDEAEEFLDICAALLLVDPEGKAELTRREEAAFTGYSHVPLTAETAQALYAPVRMNSVSRLEMFASCAYKHFIRYGMRLAERATGDFDVASLGTVYHDVLDAFSARLSQEGISWTEFTELQAQSMLSELTEEYARKTNPMMADTKKGLFEMAGIRRILFRSVMTLQYQLKKGDFTPFYTEQEFKKGEMRGRIDRMDLAHDTGRDFIKIVDYKSGHKDFDVTLMYYGLQMQLITYMDAALEQQKTEHPETEQVPAALLYYRVADPLINGDTQGLSPTVSTEEVAAIRRGVLRTTGLVNSDESVLSKLDKEMDGKSDVIPISKKDGKYSTDSNVFTTDDYELLSGYVAEREAEFSDRVTAGEIAVNPVWCKQTDACTYCAYSSICGYDISIPGYQKQLLSETTMQEVLEKIREGKKENNK